MGITVKKKSNYAITVWLDENSQWSGHLLDLEAFVSGDNPQAVLKELGYIISRNEKSRRS